MVLLIIQKANYSLNVLNLLLLRYLIQLFSAQILCYKETLFSPAWQQLLRPQFASGFMKRLLQILAADLFVIFMEYS